MHLSPANSSHAVPACGQALQIHSSAPVINMPDCFLLSHQFFVDVCFAANLHNVHQSRKGFPEQQMLQIVCSGSLSFNVAELQVHSMRHLILVTDFAGCSHPSSSHCLWSLLATCAAGSQCMRGWDC